MQEIGSRVLNAKLKNDHFPSEYTPLSDGSTQSIDKAPLHCTAEEL